MTDLLSLALAGALFVIGAQLMNLPSMQMDAYQTRPNAFVFWLFTIEGMLGPLAHLAFVLLAGFCLYKLGIWPSLAFLLTGVAAGRAFTLAVSAIGRPSTSVVAGALIVGPAITIGASILMYRNLYLAP